MRNQTIQDTDLTFFTNEEGKSTLLDRFKTVLKDVQYFDVLVGYFRTSGFFRLYESFESIDKIRILVGLGLDREAVDIIQTNQSKGLLDFESHKRTKDTFSKNVVSELSTIEENAETELGIRKFIEFLKQDCVDHKEDQEFGGNGKKLEIRVYPSKNIHAKVYIGKYFPEDRDYGCVITGSSNFSESGLVAQREFNVQLKEKRDVLYAEEQFNKLWKEGVPVSEEFVQTVEKKTWLNDKLSPYDLYLKLIYEYLEEDINLDEEMLAPYLPSGFMQLEYQKQAVISAYKTLEAYNGVFLADVVGLGKTYISAMLAQRLPGNILVVCPPVLKKYWEKSFFDFGVRGAIVESMGKLDKIIKEGPDRFDYIFVDEAHRFRNESTNRYASLHQICWEKKVILVSATPLNNTIDDIYSQVKLFQAPKNSTIPGLTNIDAFFNRLRRSINQNEKGTPEHLEAVRAAAEQVRDRLLKYIMIRRTRKDVLNYFQDDITKQGLIFPEIAQPQRIVYKFGDRIEHLFSETMLILRRVTYARYTPLLFRLDRQLDTFEQAAQINIGGFMKTLMVKRLESSFFAFKNTLVRVCESYQRFIDMFDKGTIYISKKVNVFDLLDDDNEAKLLQLVEEEKARRYDSRIFSEEFRELLQSDLDNLTAIKQLWQGVDDDPKLDQFIQELKKNPVLKKQKLVIFTESKETGEHLFFHLNKAFPHQVLNYSSQGAMFRDQSQITHSVARDIILQNFDPNHDQPQDDIRFLITTDVLAEGINLHRSHILVNYDLPWNPTRVLQRAGRVNRLGSVSPEVFIFNFFPTTQSDEHLGLEGNIIAKIQTFHDTLGEDAKYLSESEESESKELFGQNLFNRLNRKESYEGEESEQESDLKYLKILRDIRDKDPDLFEKIKRLPKKARTAKETNLLENAELLTFFRIGKLKKFFLGGQEVNFFEAASLLVCKPETSKIPIPSDYYPKLTQNKQALDLRMSGAQEEEATRSNRGKNLNYILRRLKSKDISRFKGFTEPDEEFLRYVRERLEQGTIPKKVAKEAAAKIEEVLEPHKVLNILKAHIPFQAGSLSLVNKRHHVARREVILSAYLQS